jgi:hypothetical protein
MHFATAVCDVVVNRYMMRLSSTTGVNMKLTDYQRSQLKAAACFGGDQIDMVAASLQRENPEAFLRDNELHQRNFYHEPKSYGSPVPHRSYVQRLVVRRREQDNERDQVMAQNHYLTYTHQIGVGS